MHRFRNFILLATAFVLLVAAFVSTKDWIRMILLRYFWGQNASTGQSELYVCGQQNASVKIEVFSDFQCRHCRDFYLQTIKPIVASYSSTNKLAVIYHDFPLQANPYALKAACLAQAAHRIGHAQWLHVMDALYEEQEIWSTNGKIEATLSKVLDPKDLLRIEKEAEAPWIYAAIREDIKLGQSRGVVMTPTVFFDEGIGNRQRIEQAVPFTIMKEYLDGLLR